jgi:hypothetical protein
MNLRQEPQRFKNRNSIMKNPTIHSADDCGNTSTPRSLRVARQETCPPGARLRAPIWLLLAVLAACLASTVRAQLGTPNPPGNMSYQGFLTDANGNALAPNTPTNYNVFFRIYNTPAGSTNSPLWGELQTVTVDKGYFSVILGQGTPIPGGPQANGDLTPTFKASDASVRYIGLTVQGLNPSGGDTEIQPRLRLLSSPYAFLAANANSLVSSNGGGQIVTTLGTSSVGIDQIPSLSDALDVTGNVKITGALSTTGGLAVAGQTTLAGLTASGAASLSTLSVSGAASFAGVNTFSGTVALNGAITGSGTASFGGLHLSGGLTAGAANLSSLSLGGAAVSEGVLSLGGSAHLNDNPLYIRDTTDHNHWLGYTNSYSYTIELIPPLFGSPGVFETITDTFDGPALMGFQGGLLGTTDGGANYSLWWQDNGNVNVRNTLAQGSDRNVKERIEELNVKDVLAKVTALPISKWSYKSDPAQRHIGPMAQDFYAAFKLGGDERHIATIDDAGVALAAIKGLNEVVQEKDAELQALKQQVQELRTMVQSLVKAGNAKSE